MATERLSMRKIREILRQKWVLARSHRQIAGALAIGPGSVSETVTRAKAAGLCEYGAVEALDDATLEQKLYPRHAQHQRPLPDPEYLAKELLRTG